MSAMILNGSVMYTHIRRENDKKKMWPNVNNWQIVGEHIIRVL